MGGGCPLGKLLQNCSGALLLGHPVTQGNAATRPLQPIIFFFFRAAAQPSALHSSAAQSGCSSCHEGTVSGILDHRRPLKKQQPNNTHSLAAAQSAQALQDAPWTITGQLKSKTHDVWPLGAAYVGSVDTAATGMAQPVQTGGCSFTHACPLTSTVGISGLRKQQALKRSSSLTATTTSTLGTAMLRCTSTAHTAVHYSPHSAPFFFSGIFRAAAMAWWSLSCRDGRLSKLS